MSKCKASDNGTNHLVNLDGVCLLCGDVVQPTKANSALAEVLGQTSGDNIPVLPDMVNSPAHYTQAGIECIDAITAATSGKPGIEAVCVANVVKYLWRYELKNGVEDVRKARWYLDRLIQELEKDA